MRKSPEGGSGCSQPSAFAGLPGDAHGSAAQGGTLRERLRQAVEERTPRRPTGSQRFLRHFTLYLISLVGWAGVISAIVNHYPWYWVIVVMIVCATLGAIAEMWWDRLV